MDNEQEKRRVILQVIYILILAASAMGDMPSFTADMSRAMKAISLLIVLIGASMLCVSGEYN